MKNLLIIIFVGLSVGVSCSLNPRGDSDKQKLFPKDKTLMDEPHPDKMKDSKRKKTPLNIHDKEKDSSSEISENESKGLKKEKNSNTTQKKKSSQISAHGGSKGKPEEVLEKEGSFESRIKLVKVNGMVCAFCSNSIEKKLSNKKLWNPSKLIWNPKQ